MNERGYISLIEVLPPIESVHELREMATEAQQFLFEHGKHYTSPDELMFITLLDRYIKLFEKAKEMVARDRFTVANKGDPNKKLANIGDFEIIPIQKKA